MIMDAGIDLDQLSGLRYLSLGGSLCDPSRLCALTKALGERVAIQLSMTELGAGTVLLGREYLDADGTLNPRHRSAGRPVARLDVRVVDDRGGRYEGGAEGELELRGPMVSPGYLGDEVANREARDGEWFRTGDVARVDEDGFVYIVDRKKDMVISGGFNVYPSEVEAVLYQHAAVGEACVFSVPDDKWGESVAAHVVLKPGTAADAAAIDAFCAERLAGFKRPRRIEFVQALQKNANGKIARKLIQAPYWAGRERRVN
jgi:long-chain acyl-CoA synthetase